ncbi:hypothetical protein [Methyloglobulus sp.]|uniref:hypothetical protein n=1 Tax=Methyloglobulus sp. TaxID=2518622 RepID=UPI0039894779
MQEAGRGMLPNAVKLSRHTGMDCRYPVHRDLCLDAILGFRQSMPERRIFS